MINLRSGKTGPILGMIGLLAFALALAGARLAGIEIPKPARTVIFVLAIVPAAWLTLLYWGRLDEAAREAQKAAWFWGGGVGTMLGFLAVVTAAARDPTFGGLLAPDASPLMLVQAGAIGVIAGQVLGFFAGWAIWWWSKR